MLSATAVIRLVFSSLDIFSRPVRLRTLPGWFSNMVEGEGEEEACLSVGRGRIYGGRLEYCR